MIQKFVWKTYGLLKRGNASKTLMNQFFKENGFRCEEDFLLAFTTEHLQDLALETVVEKSKFSASSKEKEKIGESTLSLLKRQKSLFLETLLNGMEREKMIMRNFATVSQERLGLVLMEN